MKHSSFMTRLSVLGLGLPLSAFAGIIPLTVQSPGAGFLAQAAATGCSFNSAQNLAFGNYDPLSSTGDATSATFTVSCTKNTTVTLTFSTGNSGTYTTRFMTTTSTDQLNYNIYGDAAHTEVIGNGMNGTITIRALSAPVVAPRRITVWHPPARMLAPAAIVIASSSP
ncbi:MAG: spore coat protein U domain-containing protein [Gammaproteobacteria bacterium]